MAGSSLHLNFPSTDTTSHDKLLDRNLSFQHELHAIYRELDGKDLASILAELQEQYTSLQWEYFKIDLDGDTAVNLTKFQFNMARDELIVTLCGLDCYEGSDKDYVKTSPTQIVFNYPLKKGFDVLIILGGTISSESFGDDLYTSLNRFIQLTDTPKSFHSYAGKFVKVNDTETGLVFDNAVANTSLTQLEYTVTVNGNTFLDRWIPFVNKGMIKGIKVTRLTNMGNFNFSIWTHVNGYWVYYSGEIDTILWDIMDIPFVDDSGQDSVYVRLNNEGEQSDFKIQIYVML